MSGVRLLRKIQLGKEATPGTPQAATTLWRGIGVLDDQREVKFPAEDVGIIGGTTRSYIPKLAGAINMDSIEATFEQLPHLLEAGVKAVGTGVADGAGSGKIYAYQFPTTALNTIKTYTIEGGDNQQAERMEYSFVSGFKLSGSPGEAYMMSAEWIGRQVANNAFTGSVAIPTVEEILFTKSKLYIDASGGTIGTTLVSDTLLGVELDVKTGIVPHFTANGELYFGIHQFTMPEITLKLTYLHNASAVAEKTAWRANSARLVRLLVEGSTLGTAGTLYTKKTLRVDLAGKYENFEPLGEMDGNNVLACTLRARYSSADALFAVLTVVNELASLP
jgi:hypothetical protein